MQLAVLFCTGSTLFQVLSQNGVLSYNGVLRAVEVLFDADPRWSGVAECGY
jgi:hypothetical protein